MLQANYIYYLHGPLKRVELATDLQGIDYTYTLQGALKAINNNDATKDPGGDGSTVATDAFGMVLDTATTKGVFRPNTFGRVGTIAEYNFVNVIGTTSNGLPASNLRVIIGTNGNVISAFPF